MTHRKSVNLIAQNAEGKYLMQMRNGPKTQEVPLKWGFFGGGVEGGETPDEGIAREIQEELEISAEPADFVFVTEIQCPVWHMNIYRYQKPVIWGKFVVNEGAGAAFFTYEELTQLTMSEDHRKILELLPEASS